MAKLPEKPSQDLVRENEAILKEADVLYTRINGIWERAEKKLREAGVLMPFRLHVETDESGNEYGLGVRKDGGKWRIHLVTGHVCEPNEEDDSWKLITECPLETRVELVEHIPSLFSEASIINRNAVEYLRKAADACDEKLKSLNLNF